MKNVNETCGFFEPARTAAKLALALLFAAVVALCAPGARTQAYADDGYVGFITVGVTPTYYSTYAELVHVVENVDDTSFTVDMTTDWVRSTSSGEFPRLVIPTGKRVTLNMNGHMIDKRPANEPSETTAEKDGEIILVMNGAKLTINGGPNDDAYNHDVVYYETYKDQGMDWWASRGVTQQRTGGVITGGSSTSEGGGLVIREGATVEIYDTTIVGCRARTLDGAGGCGGGVYVAGPAVTLNMYRSTIEGCSAAGTDGGGGIYVPDNGGAIIRLYGSHIDNNFASGSGGGIEMDGRNTMVFGLGQSSYGTSSVSNNVGSPGGGIFARADGVEIKDIEMKGNKAHTGGALWIARDPFVLEGLVIEGNEAVSRGSQISKGGGAYIMNSHVHGAGESYSGMQCSVIRDCTITNNSADKFAGICFNDHQNASLEKKWERKIQGVMTVKDNYADDDNYRNLCIESDDGPEEDDWIRKSVTFHLDAGSEVYIGFDTWSSESAKTKEVFFDENCAQYLYSDHIGYKIDYVTYTENGEEIAPIVKRVPADGGFQKVTVEAAKINDASHKDNSPGKKKVAGKVGTVGAGGEDGTDYDLIRGFYMHDNETNLAVFYYSDGLFYADPYTYNTHLATASWNLAFVGGYLNQDKPKWNDGNTYYNKHAAARQFFADIGCPDDSIYVSDSMLVKPGTDTIGVSIASKELAKADGEKTGDILIPVTVRGLGYEAEWVSNVTLGTAKDVEGAEAQGFAEAANKVMTEIEYYLKRFGLEEAFEEGHVKFWVSGFSRAGATANLVSKRLVDKIMAECTGDEKSQVFGYPCEAPKGGTDLADEGLKNSDNRYFCIHNMINMVDLVPYVAPVQMGFKRYGVDHYIPGGPAGEVKTTVTNVTRGGEGGPDKATTYADNEAWLTKTEPYRTQRTKMVDQLKAMDLGTTFNDYFTPMAMDFVHIKLEDGWKPVDVDFMKVYKNGDPDNQVEYFSPDVLRLAIEGVYPNQMYGVGKAAATRDVYARDGFTLQGDTYPSIQTAAQNAVKLLMTDETGFMNKAGNIMDQMPYFDLSFNNLATVYMDLIGKWDKLGDHWRKENSIYLFWRDLEKTGALDGLSSSDRKALETSFPTLINTAFNFVDADYLHHPKDNPVGYQWAKNSNETMMTVATMKTYYNYIIKCHLPQINIAWTRTYDSWYTDNHELSEYVLDQPDEVAMPKAYGSTVTGKRVELTPGDSANYLTGDQTITLENPEIAGEAIYYAIQTGSSPQNTQLYRGGIDLSLNGGTSAEIWIHAYTYSYGVKSDEALYKIQLGTNSHNLVVRDFAPDTDGSTAGNSIGTQEASAFAVAAPSSSGEGRSLMAGGIANSGLLSTAATETSRERKFTREEGADVIVQAGVPTSKYFKGWIAKVYSSGIANLDEDYGFDVTSQLPWKENGGANKVAASFTVPTTGDPFTANYQLLLKAQYGDRRKTASFAIGVPKAGRPLASSVRANDSNTSTYPVTWVYSYEKDGETKTVPASGAAYRDTSYTATITVPQDEAHDIMFMPSVNVKVREDVAEGVTASFEWEGTVTRNEGDGSITFSVTFPATGSDDGVDRPEATMSFDVMAYDGNIADENQAQERVATYSVHPNDSITITAPDISGKKFVGWYLGESGIAFEDASKFQEKTVTLNIPSALPASHAQIQAQYLPVIERVDVNLYTYSRLFELKGGKARPNRWDMTIVMADGEYEIPFQCLKLVWSPQLQNDRFANFVDYTATVEIVPNVQGYVFMRKKDGDGLYQEINRLFVLSQDMKVTFNGSDEATFYGVFDDEPSVGKVFPTTGLNELRQIKQPDNIEGVPYGKGEEDIRALLPATTKILISDGREFDADITWKTVEAADAGEYDAKVWTARGVVNLPENVDNPENANYVDLNVKLTVSVEAAETALMPSMSLPEGTYLYDQWSTLTTNETTAGAKTYYTISMEDESGNLVINEPSNSSNQADLPNNDFFISRLAAVPTTTEGFDSDDNLIEVPVKSIIVKAYTEAPGKRPSAVATFEYQFKDIPAPTATNYNYDGDEHIGVQPSPYYSLRLDSSVGDNKNAHIDEYGNVVATEPGVYTVTAELNLLNDYWKAEGESERTRDDKTLVFTIGMDKLDVVANPAEGGEVTGGGTYVRNSDVTVEASANAGYEFVNWSTEGENTVVSENPTYTFAIEGDLKLQANFARTLTVRWLDADGNVIESKTYPEGADEPTTEAEPAKSKDAQYTYAFAGWDLVDGDDETVKTYKPRYTETVNNYKVTFVDEDGTVLEEATAYPYGTAASKVAAPAEPTKADTAEYTYAFAGWSPKIAAVTGDATYKATYKATAKSPTPTPTPTPEPEPADRSKQQGSDGTSFGRGASIEAAEAALAAMTSDKSPAGTTFSPLKLKSAKQAKTNVKLAWSKVKGAKKYVLYGNKCGKKFKMKKVGTYTGKAKTVKKVAGKKLKKGTYYKFIVIALDKNNNVVSTSKVVHVATAGALKKAANPKKVVVKKSKKAISKVTVKKGKSVKLKGSYTKAKGAKVKKHVAVAFESTNKKIATVTKAGKVKGKKKGTCYVYAYAQNGKSKRIKVTVK